MAAIETPDPRHVRFKLKEPWPDFLTFYGSATGAGWIVPKKYVEKVGDDGFKKAPIGAGPYKFVSFTPGRRTGARGVRPLLAQDAERQAHGVQVIPDETTRLAALKRGEVDIVYSIRGELAEELQRTPGLTLKPAVIQGAFWVYFPEQWDAKSPWHDERVRRAASLAIDRNGINQALTLGYSQADRQRVRPPTLRILLAAAGARSTIRRRPSSCSPRPGIPKGFDAGAYYCDAAFANVGEAVLNNLRRVGIRAKLRPIERAAFFKGYSEKKFKN